MNRTGFLAYGISMVAVALLVAQGTANSLLFLYEYRGGFGPLAVASWLVATVGPIILSVLAWVISGRIGIRLRWLPHLLFIPAAYFTVRAGASMFFDSMDVLGDSMADGMSMLVAAICSMLAMLVHFVAALVFGAISIRNLVKLA